MQVTWLGHATVLIELDGVKLLTDPVLRRRVVHLGRARAVPASAAGAPDAVLISHLHWDHLDLPSLDSLGQHTRLVVPDGAGELLRRRGFESVDEVSEGMEIEIGALRIRATHAEHKPDRGPYGAKAAALGYFVRGSRTAYFAGDTDLFDGMSTLSDGLELALLPIAGWGATVPAGHLNPERAAEAVRRLRPRVVIPIHWGTYWPLYRRSPIASDATAASFVARVHEVAPDVEVRVLAVGESCAFE